MDGVTGMAMSPTTMTMMTASACTGMPMATSTSSMDSMSSTTMMMDMSEMYMVFFTATDTALFSMSWIPRTTAQYAGTCVFLVLLAVALEALLTARAMLERRWTSQALDRRYIQVLSTTSLEEAQTPQKVDDPKSATAVLTSHGLNENVKVIQRRNSIAARPWRLSVDLPRAALVTVIAGVGYLLMLAVMTMNVGYFMSVLAGYFVGELFLGRYHTDDMGSHH